MKIKIFCCCSLFHSWSGYGLISTPVYTLDSHYDVVPSYTGDRAVQGASLPALACWDFGFESRLKHGCISYVSVMCCQVDVSASSLTLVQRSPTECGVSEYDRVVSIIRRPWPSRGCCAIDGKKLCPAPGRNGYHVVIVTAKKSEAILGLLS